MSIFSPEPAASTDPFQLERLAEELASRESSRPETSPVDLPVYTPLSHQNPFLSAENFDVEQFLLSRSYTSLQDLRTELRDYMATLKEALVKLINDDYEAFISLSTDLKGEGERLTNLIAPLDLLKLEISTSQAELRAIQEEIMRKLETRATIREEKALLHLLLKISESVTRLESLLSISNPGQEGEEDHADYELFKTSSAPTSDSNDEKSVQISLNPVFVPYFGRSPANTAKHINRVAVEYTQLFYHASKARSENCAFIDEIQWKIDRIQSSISSDLDAFFASTLSAITAEAKLSELEKSKIIPDLTECLRTYDILGLWRDAEEILRAEIMRSFIKKTVFMGALSAPHSPLLPRTPSIASSFPNPNTSYSMPPRTPFTPFTAFSAQQSAFPSALGQSKSSFSRTLDDSDDLLAKLYIQILRFVERDLSSIMEIADKVSIKSRTSASISGYLQSDVKKEDSGFDIMANVIWNEVGTAIMGDLGNVVFAAGRPDEFRKNYELTQAFIRSLELLAPSPQAIESMRAHPVYSIFGKRWQLPVYFQMRWKEIVGKVEEALALPLESSRKINVDGMDTLLTPQAAAVWVALTACWSAEIYIPELSHKFWRLTLQLLSRYRGWLNDIIQQNSYSASVASAPGKNSETSAGTSTPLPERSSLDAFSADESLLHKYVLLIADIEILKSSTMMLWEEEISIMLPDMEDYEEDDYALNPQKILESTVLATTALIAPMSKMIISILTERCIGPLNTVNKMRTDLRGRKQLPTEPQPWVSSILRPLKSFFGISGSDGIGAILKDDHLQDWGGQVFENVCDKYCYHVTALRKAEEYLQKLQKGKKSTATFSLFGSAPSKDDEGKDEERIRVQLILDVHALGKDAETLNIKPMETQTFLALSKLVQRSLSESSEPA
ncbi:hypothetical protein D9757_000644 [Collybiopsis confluens]|uniref:Conserved oligomeric Golgi complex subunit 2 n=1 Tax=Collybiopsis confluens TaxID=2823264 RepID=A0A8H5I1G8_9AGAR|nr:hypothetical protein D9757_000644 [Collybiopsis confluens]